MSRPLRVEYPGAWYHVMNRGLNRRLIFYDSEDYTLFLETLGEACARFNVRLAAYCLMPNHYHALIHTPEGNLSRFMRHLNGVYTQRFNRRHQRDGPLFRGRFKGILVQENDYLLQVVKYIHHNPLKAGLVDTLKQFPWSSHRCYLKCRSSGGPQWLESEFILGHFAKRRVKAVSLYKEFMRQDLNPDVDAFYSRKYWGGILGQPVFVEKIKRKILESDLIQDREVKGTRSLRGKAQVDLINAKVCAHYKIKKEELFESDRGQANIPRGMAVALAREFSGLTLAELADAYEAKTYQTIASVCFRFKRYVKKGKELSKQYIRLRKTCSQEKT